jgi:hypothetical protein
MKKFSQRSMIQIDTMESDLSKVFIEALKWSDIDFGITQGSRTVSQQQKYFDDGKSKINPKKYTPEKLIEVAKHIVNNVKPLSRAGDIYIYVPLKKSLAYDIKHLCFVGGVITSTANRMFDNGEIEIKIRWGGNWDKDGEIITDQSFQDLPHFEIYKP